VRGYLFYTDLSVKKNHNNHFQSTLSFYTNQVCP